MDRPIPYYSSSTPYRTEQTLSQKNCETSFQNMLRTGDPTYGHIETRLHYGPAKKIKKKKQQRREQVSHIFTGEDPKTVKESTKRHYYFTNRSQIFFNDYVFIKPKIKPQRKTRYEYEKQIKERTLHPYSDEFYLPPQRKKVIQKKIEFDYLHNPIRTYTKEEIDLYNQKILEKNRRRYKDFEKTYDSSSCKRLLGGIRPKKNGFYDNRVNKITNNDPNINQSSIILNRNENKEVPYWAKKHFRYASAGRRGCMTFC